MYVCRKPSLKVSTRFDALVKPLCVSSSPVAEDTSPRRGSVKDRIAAMNAAKSAQRTRDGGTSKPRRSSVKELSARFGKSSSPISPGKAHSTASKVAQPTSPAPSPAPAPAVPTPAAAPAASEEAQDRPRAMSIKDRMAALAAQSGGSRIGSPTATASPSPARQKRPAPSSVEASEGSSPKTDATGVALVCGVVRCGIVA